MKTLSAILATVALVTFGTASAGPLADVMLLHLDEGTGITATDYTGNAYDGTLTNGPAWTSDAPFGQALDFNGTSAYVETPLTDVLSLPLSVEAWVKTTDGSGGIVNKYKSGSWNGFQVFMDGGHLSAWYLSTSSHATRTDTSGDADLLIADGAWHHSVTVFDSTGTTQYVDGDLAVHVGWNAGGPANFTDNTTPVRLATYPTSSGAPNIFLDGQIDEVAIYKKALTADEARARYEGGPPQPVLPPADVVCLNLDEGTGTTTWDEGTHTNATLYSNGGPSDALWTSDGKFGSALSFDSAHRQYAETTLTDPQPVPFSVEAWVKGDPSLTGHVGIVNKYGSSSLEGFQLFSNNGDLSAWYYTHSTHAVAYSSSPIDDDLWHHCAAVYDESGVRLYYDGELVRTGGWSAGVGTSVETTPLRLGTYPNVGGGVSTDTSRYFDGSIDEVALYGRELTDEEIRARYLDGPPATPEPATVCLLGLGLAALARRRRRGH